MLCSICGSENQAASNFCSQCGVALRPRDVAGGERKTITVLFADIQGSMDLLRDLDPEDARKVIDPALALMARAVKRFDGYVAQTTGDGIFAFFGAPVAHEDDPRRAIHAGLEMQDAIGRLSDELQKSGLPRIQIRVGVNTGEVVLRHLPTDDSRAEYLPIGHPSSFARRLESLATPGAVVVSSETRRLTEGLFRFEQLKPAQVKGVREPVVAFEVVAMGPARTRSQASVHQGLVKFVGRSGEISELRDALAQARHGAGQFRAVVGELGVGKSRLFHEFKAARNGEMLLEAQALPFGKMSAYAPVVEMLREYFDISPDDDAGSRREKISARIETRTSNAAETLPYILALFDASGPDNPVADMDRPIRRQRTFDAIRRIFLDESLRQPLILIFEDLHWLDDESLALVELLAGSIAGASILLLVNHRPQFARDWGRASCVKIVKLGALGLSGAQEMLSAMLGAADIPQPLTRFIIEKTEGNPFFIEELVKTLLEQEIIVRNADGSLKLTRPLPELRLPATVKGVIASRIDRLRPAEKETLQTVSVIGTEFPLELARKLVDRSDDELGPLLSELEDKDFIHRRDESGKEYSFKHALTHDVAYGSILLDRRKALHEQTAAAIEQMFAQHLSDHLGQLAHHYGCSGNARKALQYLSLSGRQDYERSALSEAAAQFTSALKLIERMPRDREIVEQEVAIRIRLGNCLMDTKGFSADEVAQVFNQARELCKGVGESAELMNSLFGLWAFNFFSGRLQTSCELGAQMLDIAEHMRAPEGLMPAHMALGHVYLSFGQFETALAHCEEGAAVFPRGEPLPAFLARSVTACHGFAAIALAFLGYPAQAVRRCRERVDPDVEGAPAVQASNALVCSGYVHALVRDARGTLDRSSRLMSLSEKAGLALQRTWGLLQHGYALVNDGSIEEGIHELREGVAACRAAGSLTHFTDVSAWLAQALLLLGRVDEGLATVTAALEVSKKTHETWYLSELYRLRGELLMARAPSSEKPERWFRIAVETAACQRSRLFQLRATASLARMLQSQGRCHEARNSLAEAYRWFTEGFDFADLQEARVLLEDLGAEKGTG